MNQNGDIEIGDVVWIVQPMDTMDILSMSSYNVNLCERTIWKICNIHNIHCSRIIPRGTKGRVLGVLTGMFLIHWIDECHHHQDGWYNSCRFKSIYENRPKEVVNILFEMGYI